MRLVVASVRPSLRALIETELCHAQCEVQASKMFISINLPRSQCCSVKILEKNGNNSRVYKKYEIEVWSLCLI